MSKISDLLDDNGIRYMRKEVKKGASGNRVYLPKGVNGWILIIPEMADKSDELADHLEELRSCISRCEAMREVAQTQLVPCASVPDYENTGRDNNICKSCPFGMKIRILTEAIKRCHTPMKLAEEFYEDGPSD